jgi:basic membrane protein A and related proteins
MRRFSGIAHVATFLALFAMLLSACGSTTTSTSPGTGGSTSTPKSSVTVALVTDVGGLNDGGFNQLAYQGYTKAQQQYGFKSVVVQTQTQTPSEYLKNLRTAAGQADMVVAVGFLMQNPLDIVAKQFPNKKFAIVDGCAAPDANDDSCENLPNVAPLYFKEQEAGCIVGAMAGQMEVDGKTKVPKLLGHNTIGAVGGEPIPPVIRYIAGYKYCAEKVDPSVKFVLSYSNNFSDPTKCKSEAESQITDKQADIVFQVAGGCGLGVLDAATEKSVYSIGVDTDQSKDSTGKVRPSVITSAQKRVDAAVYYIINEAENGQYAGFVAHPLTFDLVHDGVAYATPSSDVPQDAVTTAMTYENEIKAGQLTPPTAIPS